MSVVATQRCALCGKEALSSVKEFKAAPKEALSSVKAARNSGGLEADGDRHAFCCAGCRNVWQILQESGQLQPGDDPTTTSLFQQAQALGLLGGKPDAEEAPIADLSQVQFAREGSAISDVRQCVLRIEGMWCASCAWLIGHTLTKQKGVVGAQVLFTSDTARVTYRPAKIGEDEICRAVASLGYRAAPLGETDATDPRVRARRRETLRMGIGFVFAMNVMMVSFVLYAGYITGISPTIAHAVSWLLFAFTIPVFVCAWPLFDRAIRAAARGAATMETLVCLGATTAFVYSVERMLAGSDRVYFDTAGMLLGLVLVGKYIESGVRAGANDALTLLHNLLPKKANVLSLEGGEKTVPISSLKPGDRALVRAGERIPADGTVEGGSATVDESLMTGEARPVPKAPGDAVTGGTIVLDAPVVMRIGDTPQEGTVSRMIGLVEAAFAHKTPAERLADRISRVFVPAVIALAAVTSAVLIALHAPAPMVMSRAVAILVIACPCALGIATPMAMSAGVGAAAAMGILISDGEALSTLTRLRRLVFDKTGTLTEGRFAVRAVIPENADLTRLAALERQSEHPIARAIEVYASMRNSEANVNQFERIDGAGVRGVVGGMPIFAGNSRLVEACDLDIPAAFREQAQGYERAGLTTIYWGITADVVKGFVALGDTVREGAGEAIQELTRRGIGCELVSGDSSDTVRAVAEQLGIERWLAGATPAEKADWIAQHAAEVHSKDKGAVGMVGDGVNDAPALAQADLGIAMASGADIAARAAQISLLTTDLTRLPSLLTLAQKTARVMRQNLFWAFLYNIVCVPIAVLGFVNPLWAAAAMMASSITVIANTKRLQFILSRIAPK